MAKLRDELINCVVIRGHGPGVPVSFVIGESGFASVSGSRLALRFKIIEGTVHVDQEVFDPITAELTHSIAQISSGRGEDEVWLLKAGQYRVYGRKDIIHGSASPLTPRLSSDVIEVTPLLSKVKLEPVQNTVFVLSDDSDSDSIPLTPASISKESSFFSTIPPPSPSDFATACRSKPPLPPFATSPHSVVDCLRNLSSRRGSKSVLSRLDYNSITIQKVDFLPPTFDGDIVFELPPLGDIPQSSKSGHLYGMDKKHDGHAWTRTVTSHIKSEFQLTFRTSSCLGYLRCTNSLCDYLKRSNRISPSNETEWEGTASSSFLRGCEPPSNSTVVCAICQFPPTCIDSCMAKVYYVFGQNHMSRACVHLGTHCHAVKNGNCRESNTRLKALIGEQVERTPSATNSSIVLEASKEYLGELLLCPDGVPPQPFGFDELVPILDKFKQMSSPSIRNEVTTFRYLRRFGILDSITKLRGSSNWAFVQENRFPGQGADADKVFVFKMAEIGPGSGVDLVRRMQPGGDLQDSWVMFDHVKRVKGWTTMASHVYDSTYCRVMTIAVCDMQSEDVAAQRVFWNNLNDVAGRHGMSNVNFKGFMADSAQANWNAVRITYGSGDASIRMENRERTCLFHWTQSLEKHTKANIRIDLQDQHRRMCKEYKNSTSMEDAQSKYLAIRSWWLSSGATTDDGVVRLDLWLAFWHFRYRQWGGFMDHVSYLHFIVIFSAMFIYATLSPLEFGLKSCPFSTMLSYVIFFIFTPADYRELEVDCVIFISLEYSLFNSKFYFIIPWSPFWLRFNFSLQSLSDSELAEMPSCNLAETVHNKWLQQSGKRGNDLYVATVDDMVRAFMQVVAYYGFLKGEKGGTGPGKEELKLRAAQRTAQRTGNSKGLHDAFSNMPGADKFCIRDPHLEGEEVFVSLKRKAGLAPGSEFDSHRPDKISISLPCAKSRRTNPRVVDLSSDGNVQYPGVAPNAASAPDSRSPPSSLRVQYTKYVLESDCDDRQWHIARLPKTSAKACFAQQAITKKKCIAKIVQGGKCTAAPTYTGMMDSYKKNTTEKMQFFFCNDDIERCVKGSRRKWVLSKPEIPDVWPVKIGTNLSSKEILGLQIAGFRLAERLELPPKKLFNDITTLVDLEAYPAPENPSDHPKKRYGKNIRRNLQAPTTKHHNSCASALSVVGRIRKILMVPGPALGCILNLESRSISKVSTYLVSIGQFPSCDCSSFKEMSNKSLGKRGQWTYCKHLYFIFNIICGLDPEIDVFMHAPSFSWNETKQVIQILLLKQYTA